MKRTLRILTLALFAVVVLSCATTNVEVKSRTDVETPKGATLVFPFFVAEGNPETPQAIKPNETVPEAANGSFVKQIQDRVEGKVVPVPKDALDEIDGAYEALDIIVQSMDGVSAIEQLDPTGMVIGFLQEISSKFGDGAIAVGIVFESQEQFEQAKEAKAKLPIHANTGLFSTKSLTWKWITKAEVVPGFIPSPYEKLVNDAITKSFKELDKMEKQ